jgi:hypothetical protein
VLSRAAEQPETQPMALPREPRRANDRKPVLIIQRFPHYYWSSVFALWDSEAVRVLLVWSVDTGPEAAAKWISEGDNSHKNSWEADGSAASSMVVPGQSRK